jgi:phage baseplate assembly protein gpV
MSDIPNDLPGQIRWIADQIADQKRRDRNRKRLGTVSEVDHKKGLARVEFSDQGGKKFIGPWMPWGEVAAGGTRSHIPPTVGEQVAVISESGDLADGEISMSVPSNANPRPHDGPEPVITHGDVRLQINKDEFTFTGTLRVKKGDLIVEEGDASITGSVHFKGPSVRHNDKNIGDTHIHSGVEPGGATSSVPEP